ncbi:pimeloyl-ACP methyl ester carboxylesterase [Nitrobacteraceae bacterium AZCC 2161]
MMAGQKRLLHEIKAFSEIYFTEDLKKIDVPTLIARRDDDQLAPIIASAMLSSNIVKGSTLKIYAGAPHGLNTTHADQFNADLLTFIKG